MIAEVLTGIALVQKSVEFLKSNIETAGDIRSIAGSIDDLIRGTEDCNKSRNKKSGTSLSDQFGVESVAREVIDARIAQEKLNEIRTLVDLRFGHGTWAGIVAERANRIKEAKEAAAAAKRKQIKEAIEFEEAMKQWLIAGVVLVLALGLFVGLFTVIIK